MKESRKNLSKAEEKKLTICRERVSDVSMRLGEVSAMLEKKGWPQAPVIRESANAMNLLLGRLEEIEYEIYKSKQQ